MRVLSSLDRLDGIGKRKTEKPASMEDWLQSGLPDDYDDRKCIAIGKKRVKFHLSSACCIAGYVLDFFF